MAELLRDGREARLVCMPPSATWLPVCLRLDAGASADLVEQSMLRATGTLAGQALTIGPFIGSEFGEGTGADPLFVGRTGTVIVEGDPHTVPLLARNQPRAEQPLWVRSDWQALLGFLLDPHTSSPGATALTAALLPDAAKDHPVLVLGVTPDSDADAWHGSGQLSGIGRLGLHPIPSRLSALVVGDAQLKCGLGLSPSVLSALASSLDASVSPPLAALLTLLGQEGTGDVVLQASLGSGGMPEIRFQALLSDPAAAAKLLDGACTTINAQRLSLPGGAPAWSVPVLLGLYATITGDRLIVASSPAAAASLAQLTALPSEDAAGDALAGQRRLRPAPGPARGGHALPGAGHRRARHRCASHRR